MIGDQTIARLGLSDASFDWGLPQEWWQEMLDITEQNPAGHIVWLYDEQASVFGRPYPITLLGWQLMRIFEMAQQSKRPPLRGRRREIWEQERKERIK